MESPSKSNNKDVYLLTQMQYELIQRSLEFLYGYKSKEGPSIGISIEDHNKFLIDIKDMMTYLHSQKRWNTYINEMYKEIHEVNDNG